MEKSEIEKNNKTDLTVASIKSIVGIAPIIGPALQEIFDVIVPNQRLDRLAKFAIELDTKFHDIAEEQIQLKMQQDTFIDLIEESTIQASRALSDDRINYITSIIEKTLTKEEISEIENRHLLTILKELNDIEIIWLRSYLDPRLGGDREFQEQHNDILEPIIASIGSGQTELDKSTIQKSYKEHLAALGLLERKQEIVMNGSSSSIKTTGYSITPLGKILLKQIGFEHRYL